MLKNLILSTSILLGAASMASAQSFHGLQSEIFTDANAVTESWNNLTPTNYPGYPAGASAYPGNKIPNTLANVNPTLLDPAVLVHVNGGAPTGNPSATSPAFIHHQNNYYGIYNSSPAGNGRPTGVFSIQKDSTISDLLSIGFLIESTPATNGDYFTSTGTPILIINGDTVNGVFAADFTAIPNAGVITGGTTMSTQHYFQWDLSGYGAPIDSFEIEFNVAAHALILGLQVSQSDVLYSAAAIPEPSTYALLAVGALGAAYLRRRKAA